MREVDSPSLLELHTPATALVLDRKGNDGCPPTPLLLQDEDLQAKPIPQPGCLVPNDRAEEADP